MMSGGPLPLFWFPHGRVARWSVRFAEAAEAVSLLAPLSPQSLHAQAEALGDPQASSSAGDDQGKDEEAGAQYPDGSPSDPVYQKETVTSGPTYLALDDAPSILDSEQRRGGLFTSPPDTKTQWELKHSCWCQLWGLGRLEVMGLGWEGGSSPSSMATWEGREPSAPPAPGARMQTLRLAETPTPGSLFQGLVLD